MKRRTWLKKARARMSDILRCAAVIALITLCACSHKQVVEKRDFRVNYTLKHRAVVSVDIVPASDQRPATSDNPVRHLITNKVQSEGIHREVWDGLDDKGSPVEDGEYVARIAAHYLKIKKLDPIGGAGTIFNPRAIAVTDSGHVSNEQQPARHSSERATAGATSNSPDYHYYICDTGNRRIVKLDKHGNIAQQLGSFGMGDAQLANPVDIALDADFIVSVCDAGNERIQRYDHRGIHLSTMEIMTKHEGSMEIPQEFKDPQGIAFDTYGNFLISDSGHDRVVCLNDSAWLLWEAGSYGSGPGQLSDPRGIAVDEQGNIYVADRGNGRVAVFESDGRFVRNIDSFALPDGEELTVEFPEKLAILCDGLMAVADAGQDKVIICDFEGKVLATIEDLAGPGGLHCKDGFLYVAESSRHHIARYLFEFTTDEQEWEINIGR